MASTSQFHRRAGGATSRSGQQARALFGKPFYCTTSPSWQRALHPVRPRSLSGRGSSTSSIRCNEEAPRHSWPTARPHPEGLGDEEKSDDEEPLRREIAAGKKLLNLARLFSLDRGGGVWDGATIVDADPSSCFAGAAHHLGESLSSEDPSSRAGGTSLRSRSVKRLSGSRSSIRARCCLALLSRPSGARTTTRPRQSENNPLREMRSRADALHAFVKAKRAAGDDSLQQAALDELNRAAPWMRMRSTEDGGGAWLEALCFPPLVWCLRFGLGAKEVSAARRLVENKMAEEAAERLLLDDDGPAAGGATTTASEAKRKKKERQKQKKSATNSAAEAEVGTAEPAPSKETVVVKVVDAAALAMEIVNGLVDQSASMGLANATARKKEQRAKQRLRKEAEVEAASVIEMIVSAALRDASRREKKKQSKAKREARPKLQADKDSQAPPEAITALWRPVAGAAPKPTGAGVWGSGQPFMAIEPGAADG